MTTQTLATEESMRQYYAQRAQIYERVYYKPERQGDLRAMESALAAPFAGRHVLEVACGTGWWTPHGARLAASWLATDLNPETMAIARNKTMPASVRFAAVDAYTLAGTEGQQLDQAKSQHSKQWHLQKILTNAKLSQTPAVNNP